MKNYTYVIAAQNVMGQRFYVGGVNKWSAERPDAMEFETWMKASDALDKLIDAFPKSPAVLIADVLQEEKEQA
jgi:hypothetical protein